MRKSYPMCRDLTLFPPEFQRWRHVKLCLLMRSSMLLPKPLGPQGGFVWLLPLVDLQNAAILLPRYSWLSKIVARFFLKEDITEWPGLSVSPLSPKANWLHKDIHPDHCLVLQVLSLWPTVIVPRSLNDLVMVFAGLCPILLFSFTRWSPYGLAHNGRRRW